MEKILGLKPRYFSTASACLTFLPLYPVAGFYLLCLLYKNRISFSSILIFLRFLILRNIIFYPEDNLPGFLPCFNAQNAISAILNKINKSLFKNHNFYLLPPILDIAASYDLCVHALSIHTVKAFSKILQQAQDDIFRKYFNYANTFLER